MLSRKELIFYGYGNSAFISENRQRKYTLACEDRYGEYKITWDNQVIILTSQYLHKDKVWSIGVAPAPKEQGRFPDWNIRWREIKDNSPVAVISLPHEAIIWAKDVNTCL